MIQPFEGVRPLEGLLDCTHRCFYYWLLWQNYIFLANDR